MSDEIRAAEAQYLGMLPEGMGSEGVSIRDINVSMLKIAQKLTPEIDRNQPQYIEGAEEGKIIDTATKEVYEDILFLPVKHVKKYVEWIPREKGGGFVRNYDAPPGPVDKNFKLPNGNSLNETSYFIGYVIKGGDKHLAIIAMEKTALAAARHWNTLLFTERDSNNKQVPMGFRVFKVATELKRKKNNTWYTWAISRTSGTIINWCLKFNHDLSSVAAEVKELNESGGKLLDMGAPETSPRQITSGGTARVVEAEIIPDSDDLPF